MKKQINPTIKAHLIRSAFYLLLLLGVCAIPFALAQRNAARQSMAKPAIVLDSSFNPSESKSGLAIAANPDFQGASPKKDDVTKTPEVPVTENPDPEDLIYRPAESSALSGAALKDQYFLELPEVTCGAGNIRVEATNSGNNADYATLKEAFDAINLGTHTGVINIGVCGDTTETASAVLNASGVGTANYTLVLITPTGVRTVSGAIVAGSPLIDLNGADNVTIDGLNSGGNSLTISNTTVSVTAGTSTIRLINGAQNNTITRCTVLGSSTASTTVAGGNILISTSTGGANSNNAISNNAIGPAGANLPTKGVMSLGSASPNHNTGNLIDNNNVFDFFQAAISTAAGIDLQSNTATTTVSNNRIYQTAPRIFTVSATYSGILMATSGFNNTITGNTVGFGAANGTGVTSISGSTNIFVGLNLTNGSTTTATSVQGNTVSGIVQSTASTGTGSGSAFRGIFLAAGRYDVGTTAGNTIGSLDGSSTITFTESSTGAFAGIYDFTSSSNTISNNNIGGITINGTGTGTGGFRGIVTNTLTTQLNTLTNNQIGGIAAGAITDTLVGAYAMYSIQNSAGVLVATGNTIQNISGNSNAAALIVGSGILSTAATSTAGGPHVISQNVIHSLSNNSGAANNSIYALYCQFPATTANVVERNFVHSLSITSTATTSQLVGILPVAGQGTYKNNMVRLGVDAAGAPITSGYAIYGMFEIAGTNNLYYNSVYVGGTGVASASTTFGFVSNVTAGTRNYVDNIFWNARSNASGSATNYAIALSGLAGVTSNYNDLFANGVGGCVGSAPGVTGCTLANWQTGTGKDANSISVDPLFINPNGNAATVNLHIQGASLCVSAATPISGIGNDFDNDLRNPCTPDIGADEVTPYSGPALANVSITKTADAPVVAIGSQTGFTVRLTNNSSFTATGLTFTDNLPAAPGVNWSIDAANTDAGWSVSGSPPSQSLVYSPNTLAGGTTTRAHVISATTADTCGSTLNNMAAYTVSNGCPGSSSGSASASVSVVGAYVPGFSENFDSVTPPALPAGWVAVNASGPAPLWVTSNSGVPTPVADSPPNAAFIDDPAVVSDKRLDSPSILISSPAAQLTFRQNYTFEASTLPNTFDGGVLEISIGGGAFTDIITAGGSFVAGGYTATVNTGFSNPLAGRSAWGNTSGGFITTTVNLPPAAAGQNIVLRWRMGSDTSTAGSGWRVDSIVLSEPGACPAGSPTPTATATSTVTPTATVTPTVTPTATFTPTSTATATFTPTSTATATFTPTPTATATAGTPTPTPTCTPGVILYGISNGFGTAENNQIYQIDPATGTISNTHQVTLAGFTVSRSQAMAARPGDGVLFAVIETSDFVRRLVTINPNTGVATQIGALTNLISSLAFRSTGTLWAVSGDGGSPPETLYTVNTSNAALTLQFALGNGADGETIAFHGNGLMYHSSGNASAMFESVNVDTQVVTPIGTLAGEMFAMGYNPVNGQLYGSDISGNLLTINIATGARTTIGLINGPDRNRGLAFVSGACPSATPTPTAAATATFTPTATATFTPTATATSTPTATATFTPTPTPTATTTATPTPTATCQVTYTTATTTGTITAGGTDIGNHCDDCATQINLPFPVSVYGNPPISVATVGSDGDIHFVTAPYNKLFWWDGCLPVDPMGGQDPFLNTLFPYYADLRTDVNPLQACADCGIFTQTLGTAPNRQFVIRWKATYFDFAGIAEFEVLLTEGSSTVSVIYGASQNNGATAVSGIQRDLTQFTSFSCDQALLTPTLRVNYIPTGCGSPTPTPTATSTPTATPTGTVAPTPTATATFTPTPTATATFTPTPTATFTPTPTPTPTSTCTPPYTFTVGTGTIVPGTTDTGNHVDDGTTAITLPFPYTLYGQSFTGANISSNGNIQFVSNSNLLTNACPLPSATFDMPIMPHWDDLRTDQVGTGCTAYGGVGCGVFTSISGTAPNRIFNIEWRTVYFGANTTRANFELRLYEGQNRFDMVYGEVAQTGSSATVGVQQGTGAQFTQYECNTAGTVKSGLQLVFTEPPCGTPTPTPTATATPSCTPGWSAGAPLPTPGVRSVGVYFPANGKFYEMGGRSADTAGSDFTHPFEYDPAANTWTSKAATYADNQVNNMACGVLTDAGTPYIYCVGGSAAGATVATGRVFRYNPVTDTISPIAAPWPQGTVNVLPGGFTIFQNKLYILGGFDIPGGIATNQIWEFTPTTNAWVQKATVLPVPRGYIPTTTIGTLIFTGGGAAITAGAITDAAESFVYNPVADSISPIANIPRATGETRALNVNNKMWVMGGGRTAPNPSNEVDIYDPVAGTWSIGAPFTTARRNFPTDTDGSNRVWLAGGYAPTTPTDSMEIFGICGTPTPTPTATPTATSSPTATPTATFTPTPTATATFTPTPTATATFTPTATATATFTPTATATATFTPTATATATFTPTATATATATPTIPPRPSPTPRPRPTPPPRP